MYVCICVYHIHTYMYNNCCCRRRRCCWHLLTLILFFFFLFFFFFFFLNSQMIGIGMGGLEVVKSPIYLRCVWMKRRTNIACAHEICNNEILNWIHQNFSDFPFYSTVPGARYSRYHVPLVYICEKQQTKKTEIYDHINIYYYTRYKLCLFTVNCIHKCSTHLTFSLQYMWCTPVWYTCVVPVHHSTTFLSLRKGPFDELMIFGTRPRKLLLASSE